MAKVDKKKAIIKAAMMKAEAKEGPKGNPKESAAYQEKEEKYGVEKHPNEDGDKGKENEPDEDDKKPMASKFPNLKKNLKK